MVEDFTRTSPAQRLPVLALLSANAVSITGNAMADVAIPWFVLETTGSAAKTGFTFAVIGFSKVLAAFFGGPIVDRIGYKRCSVSADILSGVAVALVPLLYAQVKSPGKQYQLIGFGVSTAIEDLGPGAPGWTFPVFPSLYPV